VGAGAEDGAQLLPENLRLAQRAPDAAPAEKGVRLRLPVYFAAGQFVAADVEGADDQAAWSRRARRHDVIRRLFVLIRPFLAVEEQKFRAVEADAFSPLGHRAFGLAGQLDVGGDDN